MGLLKEIPQKSLKNIFHHFILDQSTGVHSQHSSTL